MFRQPECVGMGNWMQLMNALIGVYIIACGSCLLPCE